MSFIVFGNLAVSVPKTKDTTPCMNQMLQYEECLGDGNVTHLEVMHPSWPTLFPRLLTDGQLLSDQKDEQFPLTQKQKQFMWECEEERFVFKACLRKLSSLKRKKTHKSWNTAEVSNLQFTQLNYKYKNYFENGFI